MKPSVKDVRRGSAHLSGRIYHYADQYQRSKLWKVRGFNGVVMARGAVVEVRLRGGREDYADATNV